ncbi:MAG: HAMP domain-containing histidine kinase [Catenulispora sp.]|nr:HAMP domain-containing histidine kinase [Catenulispora sp.]
MNLRTRVAVSGAVAVVAALVLVAAIEYPAIDYGLHADLDKQLSSASLSDEDLKKTLVKQGGEKDPAITIPSGSRLLNLLLVPVAGQFDKLGPVTARDVAVGAGTLPAYFEDLEVNGSLFRVYVTPLRLKDYPGAVARIAEPESDRTTTLHQFGWLLAALIPVAGLLAALGARLLAARVLSPVARLTSAVEHVAATGDLSTPIAVRGRDEVARLGWAFNAMTSALDGSVGAQRRLVADASHELRTPLTSLVTNLELLAERPDDPQAPRLVAEALWQARELTALTNDLVDLARYGEAPARDELVPVDLMCADLAERRGTRLVVGTAIQLPPSQLPSHGTSATGGPDWNAAPLWELGAAPAPLWEARTAPALSRQPGLAPALASAPVHGHAPPLLVRGDPAGLERAVANLVDNALKFGSAALIAVWARAGAVIIEVCDDGPGIPEADLPYIFDRFHRSEAARALPGSGLGLAIVKQLVEAHHGSVAALPSPRGALLRITLPAAAAP